MFRSDHRELRNSQVKLMWVGGGMQPNLETAIGFKRQSLVNISIFTSENDKLIEQWNNDGYCEPTKEIIWKRCHDQLRELQSRLQVRPGKIALWKENWDEISGTTVVTVTGTELTTGLMMMMMAMEFPIMKMKIIMRVIMMRNATKRIWRKWRQSRPSLGPWLKIVVILMDMWTVEHVQERINRYFIIVMSRWSYTIDKFLNAHCRAESASFPFNYTRRGKAWTEKSILKILKLKFFVNEIFLYRVMMWDC